MSHHPLEAAVSAALAAAQVAAPDRHCVTVSLSLKVAVSAWPFTLATAQFPATIHPLEVQVVEVEAEGVASGGCVSEAEEEGTLLLAAADLACTVEALPVSGQGAGAVVEKLAALEAAQQAVVRKALRWLGTTPQAEAPAEGAGGLAAATAALAALATDEMASQPPCSPATPPRLRIPPMLLGTPPSAAASDGISTEEVLSVLATMTVEMEALRAALAGEGERAVDSWLRARLSELGEGSGREG